ncbi:MAG TPA: hypothetical protein VF762_23460 [Blastocatellia bacterium]
MANEETNTTQIDAATTDAAQQSAAEQPAGDPDSRRVRIVRVEREDGPAICIPYDHKSGAQQHWYSDPEKKTFEVPAAIAAAAVASGFFAEAANSKTKLVRTTDRRPE